MHLTYKTLTERDYQVPASIPDETESTERNVPTPYVQMRKQDTHSQYVRATPPTLSNSSSLMWIIEPWRSAVRALCVLCVTYTRTLEMMGFASRRVPVHACHGEEGERLNSICHLRGSLSFLCQDGGKVGEGDKRVCAFFKGG